MDGSAVLVNPVDFPIPRSRIALPLWTEYSQLSDQFLVANLDQIFLSTQLQRHIHSNKGRALKQWEKGRICLKTSRNSGKSLTLKFSVFLPYGLDTFPRHPNIGGESVFLLHMRAYLGGLPELVFALLNEQCGTIPYFTQAIRPYKTLGIFYSRHTLFSTRQAAPEVSKRAAFTAKKP